MFFSTQLLLLCFAAFLLISESSLVPVPLLPRAAGVFMPIEGGTYTLNFTAATAVCRALNDSVATRAQMERAVQQGLQTCIFGWIHEKIVVIPRLTSNSNCGQGKTGVVSWFVSEDRKFGVYCFHASDLEETTKAHPKTSTSSITPTAQTRTSAPTKTRLQSTAMSPSSKASEAPEQPSPTSPFALLLQTTLTARPSRKPFSTQSATPPPFVSSKPGVSAAVHDFNVSVSSESAPLPSLHTAGPSLGAVFTGIIVLGVVFLLLVAAGAVWHYKQKLFSWYQPKHKDDMETEMWKHTHSEMDLHSQLEEDEGEEAENEPDRMYSTEILLCVNPNIIGNSSQ